MIIETKFFTVRVEDLSAVGHNDTGSLFLVFESGSTQHVKYGKSEECDADMRRLTDAMNVVDAGNDE